MNRIKSVTFFFSRIMRKSVCRLWHPCQIHGSESCPAGFRKGGLGYLQQLCIPRGCWELGSCYPKSFFFVHAAPRFSPKKMSNKYFKCITLERYWTIAILDPCVSWLAWSLFRVNAIYGRQWDFWFQMWASLPCSFLYFNPDFFF